MSAGVNETCEYPSEMSSLSPNSKGSEELSAVPTPVVHPLTSLNPVNDMFFVEVIKNGLVLSKKFINKSVTTFGRSRDCDFPMDHPSISRYHCSLLWKEDPNDSKSFGFFYLMDLNSTHGSYLNKQKLDAKKLVKVIPGNTVFKLGGSSRVFMLNSNIDYQAEELVANEKESTDEGPLYCSWGILDEPTVEREEEETASPLVSVLALLQTDFTSVATVNDNVYRENPQKTIQQWFEREGYEYQYKINCINGKFKCTFELPIDGQDVVVEGKLFLKKKESIADACLRCCQLLDKANILFPWQIQKAQQKAAYGSDSEDDLIDETGETEKKRDKKEASNTINTFETLTEKWKNLSAELQSLKAKLAAMNVASAKQIHVNDDSGDALDSFMDSLKDNDCRVSSTIDSKIQKSKLKIKISELEKSQKRVERLLKLAKPNKSLQELNIVSTSNASTKETLLSKEAIRAKIDNAVKRKIEEKSTLVGSDMNDKLQQKQIKPNKRVTIEKTSNVFLDTEEECFKKPQEIPPNKEREKTIPEVKSKKKPKTEMYTEKDDYIDWLPPSTQTGDGRTSLNDKYGY